MKKLGLWLTSICLIVCSAFAFAGCNFGKKPDGESSVGVTQKYVELSESEISMEIYTQHTLTVVTNVEEAIVWTTSDASVATVEDGVITACLEGSATITATAGTESATCVVTVTHLSSFPEIILSSDALELVEGGDSILVTATASYKGEAVDCEFTWVTANPSIATVENGKVTPVGIGTTTVTVTAVCMGETLSREIPVVVNVDEIIQVSKPTLALALAQVTAGDMTADTFTVEAYRKGVAVDTAFTVASSNEEVATVLLNGKEITVTAVGEGDCHISVYYDSENGRIQSFVEVNVYRSKIAMREEVRVKYNGEETVLDLTALALAGEFEGVYANGELVSDADGKLAKAFVEVYKGSVANVEIRTSVAVYSARMRIVVPYIAKVVQGDSRAKMPTYTGDVTTLGFTAGTTVYALENATPDNIYTDGWNKRAIISTSAAQDYVTIEFVTTKDITGNAGVFHVWGEEGGTDMNAIWTTTRGDALITNMDGSAIGGIAAGTHYLVHIYCEGLTEIQVGLISGGNTVYFANIACNNGTFGVVEPPVSQGEMRGPMPTYDGDVTALGFEEGTVVYEIDGPQSDATDVKLVALVDAAGDNAFAKLDFVLSKATTTIGLWITAKDIHLGYYTITPTGFTTDGNGDPSRNIFVTDANGESVNSFDANKVYTLYVGLDGREATIQLSIWADLTVYVANIDCITEAEAPVEPTPPTQGEEISILFIGNSFSDDTEAYMVDILLSLGYTNINIGNLYIGGCSIDTHYQNIMSNAKNYEFRMRSHNGKKYTEYEPITIDGVRRSLGFAIAYKDWDIISVQQASGDSGKADSYNNLDALVAEVKKQATNADVEIVFNMTWAYQSDCTHAQFPDYNSDQMTMYNAIVNAVQSKVTYTVVPNGTAIQNARTSLLGDNLTRDGYHLDLTVGRFIAGLTFVAKVTGVDITDIEYAPGTMNELQIAIAIESVQNALAHPFTITESEIEEEVVADPDVYAGGSNTTAVTVYKGDVTALGFAEGTTVYEYVGVNSDTDKAAIKVDSVNYDYVDVQFVITKGDGYFFLFGRKGGNWHNGGLSYVVDPGWLRFGDGTSSDRVIEVFDAQGNKVTALMSANTLYTLRVFTKVGELDEILIGKNGSTIYLANVTQGLESELPQPEKEGPIKQGDTQVSMPNYKGDETAVGFEEGEYLQYMVTETTDNVWAAEPTSGKTREQLAAKIHGEAGKYVTIKFSTSEDIASGSVFYVWGLLGQNYTENGGLNFTSTTYGRILDENGYAVTSIKKNTVYILELYIEETDTYKVSNICSTGMEVYFAADSITCSDTSMEVKNA